MGDAWRGENMAQPRQAAARVGRREGIQRSAKRPDAKEGGREEEEKRLGIATATIGGRLRRAKTWRPDNTCIGVAVPLLSGDAVEKFRGWWSMCPPGGWVAELN